MAGTVAASVATYTYISMEFGTENVRVKFEGKVAFRLLEWTPIVSKDDDAVAETAVVCACTVALYDS